MKMGRWLSFFILFQDLISFLVFLESCFASDTITSNQSFTDGDILVSSSQRFELGFFSPGNTKSRYLGIWYRRAPHTVVWVANRNNPIADTYGVLSVSHNGTLLLHNQTKGIVWSSNASRVAQRPVMQLLDTGNLVVRENTSLNSGSYTWQSFDFPTDTRLPGMKIGRDFDSDLDRQLVSWKSSDDPSQGEFTYGIDRHGWPQIVIHEGSVRKFRSGPWNGIRFSGYPTIVSPNYVPEPFFKDDLLYYLSDAFNDSIITRLTLNQSGVLQRYRLNERATEWSLMFTEPKDECDTYGLCGANGICRIYNTPLCECLSGFTPKSLEEWEVLDWSSGCTRRTIVDCHGGEGEGFLKVERVKLPDSLDFWSNKSMSLEECGAECLKNCSCVAYANSNISEGGSGCFMWFKDLIDVREFIEDDGSRQDIYIRLAASDLESIGSSNKKRRRRIALGVSVIAGILMLGMVLWYAIRKKRRKEKGEEWDLPLFDIGTIAAAASNFSDSNVLGVGGFGPVYKGILPTGQEIAVKRMSKDSRQGLEEFMNEVALIAKLQHRNLVRLLGCCIQKEEWMLVYEYMPNKSLDYFIFVEKRRELLSWQMRFDIVMGIARGLLYLHQDSRLRIIHRDLKTSNILLDSEMNPKISDFGLARIFEGNQNCARTKRVIGTHGYMSPEYVVDGRFSTKSDVFSFGVLLLEIVSGKKNRGFSHPNHHHNLLGHAWMLWHEDAALGIVDACLEDSYVQSQVLRCIQVSLLCVQKLPEDRPSMSTVVFMLGNEGAALAQPKQPGFFIERGSSNTDTISRGREFYTDAAASITILEPR